MREQWVNNQVTARTYIIRDLIKSNDSLCLAPPHYTNSNKNDMNYCKQNLLHHYLRLSFKSKKGCCELKGWFLVFLGYSTLRY